LLREEEEESCPSDNEEEGGREARGGEGAGIAGMGGKQKGNGLTRVKEKVAKHEWLRQLV